MKEHNNSRKKSEPTSKRPKTRGPMRRDTKEVLAELVEKLKEKLDPKKVAATSAGEHQRGVGLTHICARSRRGKFTVQVRTMRKRLRRGLTAVAEWCQEHRHAPVDEQQKALNAKLRGHYQYYG